MLTSWIRPPESTPSIASGAASRRPWNFACVRLRSVASRTTAVTNRPSSVSMADSEISAGNWLPSLRSPDSSSPAPIGRTWAFLKYSARWSGCTVRASDGTRVSIARPSSSSRS